MGNEQDKDGKLARRVDQPTSLAPKIKLGDNAEISLDGLRQDQQEALLEKAVNLEIELANRTKNKVVDTKILGESMGQATDAVSFPMSPLASVAKVPITSVVSARAPQGYAGRSPVQATCSRWCAP